MITDDDLLLMQEAMMLAQRGEGHVNPNPLVGAMVVKNDEVIATGYHHKYGELHAERDAFTQADQQGINCEGATLYVTLEPCCHQGKQPPCTEAIVEHKISRVVVGLNDPNPMVAGKGLEMLRQAGIEVDVMEGDARCQKMVESLRMQNRAFLKHITTGLPWLTAKWAMTLDGKIATSTGDSCWISGEESRQYVHQVRRINMAILCGIGTVLADDPMLNVRLTQETLEKTHLKEHEVRQPVRIIADRQARIPMESQLVRTAREIPTVVAYADGADDEKLQMLRDADVVLWNCNTLSELLQRAGAEGIDSILLESGGTLSEALIKEGMVDEVMAFVAPKIVGGRTAKTPVEGDGVETMAEAIELTNRTIEVFGNDVLITGLIEK